MNELEQAIIQLNDRVITLEHERDTALRGAVKFSAENQKLVTAIRAITAQIEPITNLL